MKISFCTTCMGRTHHLRTTLPLNLAGNASHADLEFVILDYNSKDDLETSIKEMVPAELESGKVKYYREREAKYFCPRRAKNMAHLLATGEIVVNIDADNFTGTSYASHLDKLFTESRDIVVTFNHSQRHGVAGKIALTKDSFVRLRGYDEGFRGYGHEDPDIIRRGVEMGLRQELIAWPGEWAIRHSTLERTERFEGAEPADITSPRNIEYAKSRPIGTVTNPAGFGVGRVFEGFTDRVINVGGAAHA